jgi:ferredoxin
MMGYGATEMPPEARLQIDRAVCIGSGECVELAPAVYELDDEGLAYVKDSSAAGDELIRRTQRLCPSGAIRFVSPTGKENS